MIIIQTLIQFITIKLLNSILLNRHIDKIRDFWNRVKHLI